MVLPSYLLFIGQGDQPASFKQTNTQTHPLQLHNNELQEPFDFGMPVGESLILAQTSSFFI